MRIHEENKEVLRMHGNAIHFPEVRLFPLNTTNFASIDDVKHYFRQELRDNGYKFDLLKMHCKCVDNTLLYFQYAGRVVASAITNAPVEGFLPIWNGSIREFSERGIPVRDLGRLGVMTIHGKLVENHVFQSAIKLAPESLHGLEESIMILENSENNEQNETVLSGIMSQDAQDLIDRIIEIEREHNHGNDGGVFIGIRPPRNVNNAFPHRNFYPSDHHGPCCPMAEFAALKVCFSRSPRPWNASRILSYIISCLSDHMINCPNTERILIVTEYWDDKRGGHLINLVNSIRHSHPQICIEGYLRIGKSKRLVQIF